MLLRLRLGQLPSPRHTCGCAQPLDISAGADTGCSCYNEYNTGCYSIGVKIAALFSLEQC